ncbi:MAG: DUF7448 domain-containing protein [Candidatus Heimdallarchaeota archaeon]
MKIFKNETNEWGDGHKINFVDENNVFVGYDMESSCCEKFGWFINNKPTTKLFDDDDEIIERVIANIDEYSFDINFFAEYKFDDYGDIINIVIFKLVNEDFDELYLHLFNCHNGYYSHGFEYKDADEIRNGDL